jgi:hypothetical protein
MIHHLSRGSKHAPSEYAGRLIVDAKLQDEEALILTFGDGTRIKIFDDGQSCCEHRYMTTGDDVQSLVNHNFVGAQVKDGPDEADEFGDVHEIQFLEIQTDAGFITLVNHNEHNGYYGGFGMQVEELPRELA